MMTIKFKHIDFSSFMLLFLFFASISFIIAYTIAYLILIKSGFFVSNSLIQSISKIDFFYIKGLISGLLLYLIITLSIGVTFILSYNFFSSIFSGVKVQIEEVEREI